MRWIDSGEIAYESESAAVFRFRDGKLLTWQPFESHSAALQAAGVTSPPEATFRRTLDAGDAVGWA